MKKIFTLLTATLTLSAQLAAQSTSLFETYAILNINGGGNTYYDCLANTANPDFTGTIANLSPGQTLVLNGGEAKTNKCGSCNVTGAHMYYRVYEKGTTPGSFLSFGTYQNLPFSANLGGNCGGDQRWAQTAANVNLLSGLPATGTFTIEVYFSSDYNGCGTGTNYASNGGNNYKADFNRCGPTTAALNGNYAIPGCFATINAAVNALNTYGVAGPVTFNVAAGHTETAPAGGINLTATGTAANRITFQKFGTGANPVVFAPVGTNAASGATIDGIISLNGSDYVIFDGINLVDNNTTNPATMEYGYGLFKSSATNGCQNDTIKNCTITLSLVNNVAGSTQGGDGSKAIGVFNTLRTTANTAVVTTSIAGRNDNNAFFGNTLSNCFMPIYMRGDGANTDYYDQNNTIGGPTPAFANIIRNWGTGTNTAYGIFTFNQNNLTIRHNIINNTMGGGTAHGASIEGIRLSNTLTTSNTSVTVSNNRITLSNNTTTGYIYGINCLNQNGTGTVTFNADTVTGCSFAASSSGTFYGIYNNSSTSATLNVTNCVVSNNTLTTTGSFAGIYNNASIGTTNNITGNKIENNTCSSTSTSYGIFNSHSGTTTINVNDNKITNSSFAGSYYGYYNFGSPSGGSQTFLRNRVSSISSTGGSFIYGLYTFTAAAQSQLFNLDTVNNLSTSSSAASVHGISGSAFASGTVSNCLVYSLSTTVGAGNAYGINVGNSSGTCNVFGNTVYDINGRSFVYGISATQQGSTYNNLVYNINNTGGTFAAGIQHSSSFASTTNNIYNNKIYGVSVSTATSATAYGIYIGPSNTGVTFNVYNNYIGDLTAPNSAWALPSVIGIGILTGGTANTGNANNISYNTIRLTNTSTAATITSGIYFSVNSGNTPLTLRNNLVINKSTAVGGNTIGFSTHGTAEKALITTTTNNNIWFAGTPSSNNNISTFNLNGGGVKYQTFCDHATFMGPTAETASATEDVPFISTIPTNNNYLHVVTGTPTAVESKGTPIAGITQDYDGDTRNATTPDIGADEGAFTALSSGSTSVTTTQVTGGTGKGTNIPVIAIPITIGSTGISITSVTCNTAGTTNTADITNAKLWYGGTTATFDATTAVQDGSTIASPSGAMNFTFTRNIPCTNTTVYYYLTYDVPCTATNGNVIDAECNSITVNATPITPTVQAPAGNRTILGPMSGIYTIGTDYATIRAAAADLNARGISANTTIRIPAGYTETNISAKGIVLNMSGTCPGTQPSASQRLRFEKFGAGANPILHAQIGGGATTPATTAANTQLDGIFAVVGTDYTTIDGLNLNDGNTTNPATMEYGYAFFKASATDACQFDTIKNCTITMKTLNNAAGSAEFDAGSKGIWMGNTLFNAMGTALAISNVTGAHSDNVFLNNTITNAYEPIYLRGVNNTSFYDNNNLIEGNTLTNYGSATGTTNTQAIYQIYNNNLRVIGNTIDNTANGGAGHVGGPLYGIFLSIGTTSTVVGNTIKLVQDANSILMGIHCVTTGSTIIRRNTIQQCSQGASALAAFTGINTTGTTNTNVIVNSNAVINNTGIRGQFNGINVAGAASGVTNIDSNRVSGNSSISTSLATMIANTGGTAPITFRFDTISNNHMGASGFNGISYNMGTAATLDVLFNQITNNSVSGGSTSCIMINGTGAGAAPTRHRVSYNNIDGFTAASNTAAFYGYYNNSSYNGTGYSVSGNTFRNISYTGSPGSTAWIIMQETNGGSPSKNIDSNTISNISTAGTNQITGIQMGFSGTANSISANSITDITTNGSIYGIWLNSGSGTTTLSRNRICNLTANGASSVISGFNQQGGTTMTYVNNIIGNFNTPIATQSVTPWIAQIGFQLSSGSADSLFYNTVFLNGTSSGANFGTAAVFMSSAVHTSMKNNVFYNSSTPTGSGRTIAIYRTSNSVTNYLPQRNTHNRMWVGTPLGTSRNLLWDGTNTLNALPFATSPYTGQEANSDTSSVGFISTACGNSNFLAPDSLSARFCIVENKGTPLPSPFNVDIRGNVRSVTAPDMGAYEVTVGYLTWTGATDRDWNLTSNWCPQRLPTLTDSVIIPNVTNQPIVGMAANNAGKRESCKSVTILAGSSLTIQNKDTLDISAGGFFTNNGTFVAGADTATTANLIGGANLYRSYQTVRFLGAGVVTGTSATTFNGLWAGGPITLPTGATRSTINGILRINTTGSVSAEPIYVRPAVLNYNTNGVYNVSHEWTGNSLTPGQGIPFHVLLTGSTVNMPTTNRGFGGSISISQGTLNLNTTSGDLYVGGNWNRNSANGTLGVNEGYFNPNCRAVYFNGSGTQTIAVTQLAGGPYTETFSYLVINKPSDTLKISNIPGALTNVRVYEGATGSECGGGAMLQLINNGILDLNGRTFMFDNIDNTANPDAHIFVNGARRIINSLGHGVGGNFAVVGSNSTNQPTFHTMSVYNNAGVGSLTFDTTVIVTLADGGADFGLSGVNPITTINGVLQINLGGSVSVTQNPCNYGVGSVLRFNNGIDFQVVPNSKTWAPGAIYSGNAGIPFNVEVLTAGTDLVLQSQRALRNNLTITNGTFTLNSGIGTFNIGGNWTRTGASSSFVPNNNRITFDGNADQTITVGGSITRETFYELEVSGNNANLNLGTATSVDVTNQLVLTTGKLITGYKAGNGDTREVNVTNCASNAIIGGSQNSYVNGKLKRCVQASTSYDFPVGSYNNYQRANVNFGANLASTTNLTASFDSIYSGTVVDSTYCVINGSRINDKLDMGFWTLTPNTQPTAGLYTITLYARGYTNAPSLASMLGVVKRDNSADNWRGCGKRNGVLQVDGSGRSLGRHQNTTQSFSAGTATVVRDSCASFSDFGVGIGVVPNMPLPVKLLYFTATKVENYAQLDWATATEINNDHFDVERSKDGLQFEKITEVKGAGNSVTTTTYQVTDHELTKLGVPVVYYRLKQVDEDGSFEYSNIAALSLEDMEDKFHVVKVSNNPFRDNLSLTYFAPADGKVSVAVYDIRGAELMNIGKTTSKGEGTFDLSQLRDLSAGIYVLKVTYGLATYSYRVQKLN